MSNELPLVYRGYKIYDEFKVAKHCRNPLSGHSWTEHKATGKVRVVGGNGLPILITTVFSSVKKAKEQIDFYIKWIPPQ